ncbi:DUF4349 domain-containing protein [Streptomyces sp. NPDC056231]|uniref:DUF4349 domain-containing protein n=1 Tax=Streptomyces sp. NPDC056231 TaxID=3345755 RepID=UPI003AAB22FC
MQSPRHSSRSSTRRSRRVLAAGMLAALLAVSGCGAADDKSGSSTKAADAADNKAAAPAGRADAASGQSDRGATEGSPDRSTGSPAPTTTHVIRKASLSVEVKDVPKAAAAARSVTEDADGLVANESTDRIDDLRETSHLVLRVPQAEYDAVLRKLAGGGKLLSRTSEAKDVTDQVVDVESRIATQRASVARVRKLMDRAEKIADVVALEGELSNRQAELESLLARQESLKDRTTLATITLDLAEPESSAQGTDDDDPGFVDALGGGWHAFVTTVKWIAMAVGAAAPFLAAAAALLLLWRLVRTRRRTRRAVEHASVPPEAPSAP